MSTVIAGEGTPEASWTAWPALSGLPGLNLTGCRRLVLVAPHPDDEVLGVGGLVRMLADRGARVELVAVTDGDASHPQSPTLSPDKLAAHRREESAAALAALGLDAVVTRLGFADGRVAESERELTAALGGVLRGADYSTWCLSTWDGDGHPDHESVGRAAREACGGARLLQYPVWTWHWAEPADARVPWHRAHRVPLGPAVTEAKRAAVGCFHTQIRPLSPDPADAAILGPAMLARLTRDFEVVFR